MTAPESPTLPEPTTPETVTTEPAALQVAAAEDEDEQARAELYGLLARLWLAPPDDAVLAEFRLAVRDVPDSGAPMDAPWRALVAALRTTDVAHATAEHDALFQGVGKPEVFLYGSYYLSGFLNERPLAQLREDLAAMGLSRDDQRGETEDHVAYGFEVMRYLIAGDDAAVCTLAQQQRFFRQHLQTWVERLCDAVEAHPRAMLWRSVSGFTRAFMQVETQAFDMLDAS